MKYIKLRDMEDEKFNVYFRTMDDKTKFIEYLVGLWHEKDYELDYGEIKTQLQEFGFLDENAIEEFVSQLEEDFNNGALENVIDFIQGAFETFSMFIEEITFDEVEY